MILSQKLLLTKFKGTLLKSINTRVMVLALCMSSMLVNICMKFHEDILRGYSYRVDMILSQNC